MKHLPTCLLALLVLEGAGALVLLSRNEPPRADTAYACKRNEHRLGVMFSKQGKSAKELSAQFDSEKARLAQMLESSGAQLESQTATIQSDKADMLEEMALRDAPPPSIGDGLKQKLGAILGQNDADGSALASYTLQGDVQYILPNSAKDTELMEQLVHAHFDAELNRSYRSECEEDSTPAAPTPTPASPGAKE